MIFLFPIKNNEGEDTFMGLSVAYCLTLSNRRVRVCLGHPVPGTEQNKQMNRSG